MAVFVYTFVVKTYFKGLHDSQRIPEGPASAVGAGTSIEVLHSDGNSAALLCQLVNVIVG